MIVAGIDAGGTKTEAIIVNERGDLLARIKGGPANFQTIGLREAVKEICTVFHRALKESNLHRVHLLGIGLAGAGRLSDLRSIKTSLLSLEAKTMHLTNDAAIAALGAHGGSPGLILIASTGSIVYGVTEKGCVVRRGGWGPILGDEGSGFWMGLQAIKASIKAKEGRGEVTQLTERIKKRLEIRELTDLISFTYQQPLPRKEIASLALDVIELSREGDLIARGIVEEGVEELKEMVSAVIKKGLIREKTIAVSGGLFESEYFKELLKRSVQDLGLLVQDPLFPPVYGAVFYAMREEGLTITKGTWHHPTSVEGCR